MPNKQIRYIISYDTEIKPYPYNFYNSFEEAENKRLQLSKTEGTIFKVIIEIPKEIKNVKKS